MFQLLSTQKEWKDAVDERPHSFLQSWEWGVMQEAYGNRVYHFSFEEIVCTAIVLSLGFSKNVLFIPYSPIAPKNFSYDDEWVERICDTHEMKEIIERDQIIAVRIEPSSAFEEKRSRLRRISDVTPATTQILSLDQSSEILLSHMKQKTRYNIRVAKKKGVETFFLSQQDAPDWETVSNDWWKLVIETGERHQIGHHTKKYYHNFFTSLGSTPLLEVGYAQHEKETLAMTIHSQYGDTYTYVHGAATHRKKNYMASYALQWAAIERAAHAGYHFYDFYGIAPHSDRTHPLAGVTRFKKGFGGVVTHHLGTFEYGTSSLYPLYRFYRSAKKSFSFFRRT